jgi:hypothetical protein
VMLVAGNVQYDRRIDVCSFRCGRGQYQPFGIVSAVGRTRSALVGRFMMLSNQPPAGLCFHLNSRIQ